MSIFSSINPIFKPFYTPRTSGGLVSFAIVHLCPLSHRLFFTIINRIFFIPSHWPICTYHFYKPWYNTYMLKISRIWNKASIDDICRSLITELTLQCVRPAKISNPEKLRENNYDDDFGIFLGGIPSQSSRINQRSWTTRTYPPFQPGLSPLHVCEQGTYNLVHETCNIQGCESC